MLLLKKLCKESCSASFHAKKKDEALHELVQLLKKCPKIKDIESSKIYFALKEREKLGSTGLGGGIAIPHAKIEGLDDFVLALAISKKGVQFDAIDNRKVHIFFVLLGPSNSPNEHLKMLSAISRTLRDEDIKNELIASRSGESIYETIAMANGEEARKELPQEKKKLLMIILYEQKYLEDIMELFLELGVKGSTVIDSQGMGGILTKVPLFADFINFLGENKNYSKTIVAIIGESELHTIIRGVEDLLGDLDKRGGASIIALDIHFVKGTMEYM